MAKLTLQDITTGFNSVNVVNSNNNLIETALENTLSRDGTTPNTMGANLDMNSNRIVNLAAPSVNSDAARLLDVTNAMTLTGITSPSGQTNKVVVSDGTTLVYRTGSGSLIDADTVDTLHATSFLRKDITNTAVAGSIAFNTGLGVYLGSGGATTAANLLDDYEEGTWTPSLVDSTLSTGEGQTYSSRSGSYTKIGQLVIAHFQMSTSSLGTLTAGDTAAISGFPFTVATGSSPTALGYTSYLTYSGFPSIVPVATASHGTLAESPSGVGAANITISDFAAATSLQATISYLTTQ